MEILANAKEYVQFVLLLLVIAGSLLGNGSVCLLLLRFKTLRTVPNILVLDLSVADGLNVIINASLFIAYFVLEIDVLRGRSVAVFTEMSFRCFLFLNLITKLLLMLDRCFAITHGIRYTAWKSRPKVYSVVFIKWVSCIALSVGSCSSLWDIDMGDVSVLDYRGRYLETNGKMMKRLTLLTNHGLYTCLALVTWRAIRSAKKNLRVEIGQRTQVALVNKRNSSKEQASKTIGIMVFCDFVFYLPLLLYLYLVLTPGFRKHDWFAFFAHFFVFVSCINNPIIYYSRTQRFRLALLKMLRDPFGSSELFELRALPAVMLVPQKGVTFKKAAMYRKEDQKGTTKQSSSTRQEMEKRAELKLETLAEHNRPVDCGLQPEGRHLPIDRNTTPIDGSTVAIVHRIFSEDGGAVSEPCHRQIKVVVSSSRAQTGKESIKEDNSKGKSGTQTSEGSSSYLSSKENTADLQETAEELLSDDSFDTWL